MGNQPLRRKRRSGIHRKKTKTMTTAKNHESQKSDVGSQKAKHQEPHPDHNPEHGVIVNPPSGDALKHEQEIEEAAKRTAVPEQKSEVSTQKSEKDAEK